ncbi:MAG: putative colanic acid biosynthesis acetyltransferase [Acidobacteriota bacterium]
MNLHRPRRALWSVVYTLLFRPSPRPFHAWRRLLLRLFGAALAPGARVYPTARIWAPWNLEMGRNACLGSGVDCYNVARITIGGHATVSQYSYLCAATHDISTLRMPLVAEPIEVGPFAWVCADVFVGPGVTIGEGAVAGARSSVYRDVEPWTVVAGNPARPLKKRIIDEHQRAYTHA